MRIRILHLVLTLDTGGLENGVVNIINGLDDSKYTSILCCIKHGGELVERLNKDIKIIELDHYSGIEKGPVKRLKEILSEEKIDIIHTRNYKPYMFGFIAGKIFGNVALIHSEHGKDYPFNKIKMIIQRICSIFTNGIIALSGDIKVNMIQHIGISGRKIKVIINGVDTNKFKPAERNPDLVREFGINEGDIVIGAVGRLVTVKNYPELLLSMKRVREKNANIKLIIVGDGPEQEAIKAIANKYDITNEVCFAGNRNDVDEMLHLFDIYVLTSSNEGLSNTLLEAMSSATPAIVSSVGGNVEIINNDEVGLTYSSGNHIELADKLLMLAENKEMRDNMAENARQHIVENYSLDAMIRNYSELYTNVYSDQHK